MMALDTFITGLMVLCTIVGTIGNIGFFVVLSRKKKFQTWQNALQINMALLDSVTIIFFLFNLVRDFTIDCCYYQLDMSQSTTHLLNKVNFDYI